MNRKELYNTLQEKYKLHLVIGEPIPQDAPEEFHTVLLYLKDENNEQKLYANISLPYLINYSEFQDIEEDPRYIFKEGYDKETSGCKYTCVIKPFGEMKGVYRILGMNFIKIGEIEPLIEEKTKVKKHVLNNNKGSN